MGHVTVLGSLNYDCICRVGEFPRPGQTVMAEALEFQLGGKGGNQAVAAARQGATVSLLGALGTDSAGEEYLHALKLHGIEREGILRREKVPTGMAMIHVNRRGENQIVVALEANATFMPEDLEQFRPQVARAAILLTQLEMPLETVLAALRLAPMMGTTTCLNPSPWRNDFPWGAVELDFVIVNEGEARNLLDRVVLHVGDAGWVLLRLETLGVQTLIVTRGADSTLVFSRRDGVQELPTLQLEPVDTTGAGDCFAGAFAAHWAQSRDLRPALRAASVAASLSTLRLGAQEAIPDRAKVEAALAEADHG
jgi:ribokinase